MNRIAQPKDAAAVVLTRGREICWAKRSPKLAFLSGWHAFPGGKVEESDREVSIENCSNAALARLIACAARECFEETGVLLCKGGDKLTKGQRASLHDDLTSGRMTFAEILAHWELRLDARDFAFAGAWTTPAFSPVRFNTRFFLVECPAKQTPFSASGEIETVEFTLPETALRRWRNGEILCAPPILHTLRAFALRNFGGETAIEKTVETLLEVAARDGENPRFIEFNSFVTVLPLRTLTLPPATHTNCFVVGRKKFVVIDAAARDENGQTALREFVDSLVADGGVCQAILTTHSHADHVGGERILQQYLREKHNQSAALAAHRSTAEVLPEIKFDLLVKDNHVFDLQDAAGDKFKLQTLHTPGHARGHLALYIEEIGFLLPGDNVVGAGSVLIAPPEGNLKNYLYSLRRMRDLPNLRFLCGSHGAAVADAPGKIESFIEHRLTREKQILAAWNAGARTARQIVERVYADTKPELWAWAEKSAAAHLEKLRADGLIEN